MANDDKIHLFHDFLKKSSFSPYNESRRPFSKFEAWVDCLYRADEHGICSFSLGDLSKRWAWGAKNKVKRFLDVLAKEKYIRYDEGENTTFYIIGYSKWTTGALPQNKFVKETEDIIEYLNKTLNKKSIREKIQYTENRRKMVAARFKENKDATVDDFKNIIILKHSQWADKPEMKHNIRMETLFIPRHFRTYLEESRSSKNKFNSEGQMSSSFWNPTIYK